jgi:hypothetical protein
MTEKPSDDRVKYYVNAYETLSEQELNRLSHEAALRTISWTLPEIHGVIAAIAGVFGITWLLMTMGGLVERGVHKVSGADQISWLVAGAAIVWGWWALKVAREARLNDRTVIAALDKIQYDRLDPEFRKKWEGR